jgi:hypothetical protein
LSKRHFGQVGHGGKKSHGGFVLLKFLVKKVMILVMVGVIGVNGTTHALETSKRFIMKCDVLFLV